MQQVAITSTRCHTCYHTRYRTFSLSLAWFVGYLQRVTTHYSQIYKKMYIKTFLEKLVVTRRKPSQITPKPC